MVDMLSPYIWVGSSMGNPIILSLYHNPSETSMAFFIATNSALRTALSTVACLFVYQMMQAILLKKWILEWVLCLTLSICMIRVHESSQNDWFSSWFLGIVRYSLLNIPIETCPSAWWKTLMSTLV